MTYYTGCIAAVPTANKDRYMQHVKDCWSIFNRHGASRMVEAWGADIKKGKVNDFFGAVEATDDETVVFSWLEWHDKAAADAAWQAMQTDTDMAKIAMPFDGSRMIFGGFEPLVTGGSDKNAGYIQGFVLSVPQGNREAYRTMADQAWEEMFRPKGCLGNYETWGVDVPHGNRTDFYRASKAEAGEVPVFSWTAWPDRATCDAASRAMEAEMEGKDFPDMPFDGRRMIWGGFDVIFDSASA
ncbi:DUF1428 domain-containing protein [Paracoccus beibuensis]|uniref:DUF1428 domain-containing protein n=1 Tax=Paracoccus beibuensis TaxID=547602 RepID=UPI00223F9FE7|nr:DUF1428 domain-containing protein [Paracoccus beibuensis]